MTHYILLDEDNFPLCYDGTKNFDLKVYSDEGQNYKDNDTIEVHDSLTGFYFIGIITRVTYFNSLEDAFELYNYKDFLPFAFSKEHAMEVYRSLRNFKLGEFNHGVIAFRITRVSDIIE